MLLLILYGVHVAIYIPRWEEGVRVSASGGVCWQDMEPVLLEVTAKFSLQH